MKVIERYHVPGQFDVAEYGQVFKVIGDNEDDISYYIQLSPDKDDPRWKRAGQFLEEAYSIEHLLKEIKRLL